MTPTANEGAFLGHAVLDGRVRYFSVSSLEKAAPREAGCLRRWWYRYVGGRSAAEKGQHEAAKKLGDDLHAELARYLRTGERSLSALAMRGLHFVPEPVRLVNGVPDMYVERSLHVFGADGPVSPLTAAGVPVIGFVDCWHRRGVNKGSEDPGDLYDPPGTIELIDWKRKGSATDRNGLSTLLRPDQLAGTIQMAGYGVWAQRAARAELVRLSHGYFPAKNGLPRKVTRLHVVDDCARTWQYVEGVARSAVDAARETSAERVDANTRACDVYGGCPHREVCSARESTSLSNLFGETAGEDLKMGLIDQLNEAQPGQQVMAGSNAPTHPVIAVPTAADLAAEEARLRAQQAPLMAQIPAAPAPPPAPVAQPMAIHPIAALWGAIQSKGRGFPALAGEAAQAFAAACGIELSGQGYAGGGAIGKLTLWNAAQITQLARELGVDVDAVTAPPPPTVVVLQPTTVHPMPGYALLPPDAPQSIPALASKPEAPPVPAAPAQPNPDGATRTRGRPRKNASTPTGAQQTAAAATLPSSVAASQGAASVGAGTQSADADLPFEVFVDCSPNVVTRSLHDYVDRALASLASKYCVDAQNRPTTQDVRCAPADGPLGFGRWKGALHALVIECPPPRDSYILDTRGNEVAEIVADAMRLVVSQRGGFFVRGYK